MKVFIHVNTSKQVDDKDHLKVFANEHAAKEWSKKPDQEGVVVECEVMASEMKPHVSQAYKDACDNLIYLKKEQFQVTNYTWLVLAALYILSRKFTAGTVGNDLLIGGAFVVGIVSLLVLWDFQSSIERFRNRLALSMRTISRKVNASALASMPKVNIGTSRRSLASRL